MAQIKIETTWGTSKDGAKWAVFTYVGEYVDVNGWGEIGAVTRQSKRGTPQNARDLANKHEQIAKELRAAAAWVVCNRDVLASDR